MNHFYINELLRARLWPLIHIIWTTRRFCEKKSFIEHNKLPELLSQAAGHVSHETQSLIPDFLTIPLRLLKHSSSSTARPGGEFWVNWVLRKLPRRYLHPAGIRTASLLCQDTALNTAYPGFTRPLLGQKRTLVISD